MINHLLFDADGVLFFHSDKLFSERLIEEYGSDRTDVEQFFAEVFPDCIVNKKDLKQELAARLKDWNWPSSVEALMDYWYEYEHAMDELLLAYISNLKEQGLASYVATNNDHYRAAWLFKHLNLDIALFDRLYAAGDMGVAKPEPAFLQHIVEDLGISDRSTMLFWDDTPANVSAARSFGLQAELYTTFDDFEAKMKHYV